MSRIVALQDEYRRLEAEQSALIESRQALGAQEAENKTVKAEFSKLTPNNNVFKQIGPVLVKQDQAEAKANVDKRLEFIASEIKRVESKLKDLSTKLDVTRMELVKLSTEEQAKAQQAQEA